MNNFVSDLITRIKNGYLGTCSNVKAPYSRGSESIVKILKQEGFIKDFKLEGDANKKNLVIDLLYIDKNPAFTDVRIFSKPGRRMYRGVSEIRSVIGGIGIAIMSTPKGIMTGKQARKENVGGEILFELW